MFRVYVSESLRMISENTAHFGGGSYMTVKYDDVIRPAAPVTEDPRSCLEIATEIFARAKGGK